MRPSLCSDDVTMAQDLFGVMRTTFTCSACSSCSAAQRRPNPPRFLTCREVLEFATMRARAARDLDRKVGTLTPGKDADIVMLRADRINVWPLNNAPATSST